MKSRPGKFTIAIFSLLAALPVAAQQAGNVKQQEQTMFSNPVFNVMLVMIVLLLLVIIAMAEMVKAGAAQNVARAKKKKGNSGTTITGIFLLFLFSATTLNAASTGAAPAKTYPAASFDYWGMGAPTFYVMLVIILFELLIAAMLFRSGMKLIALNAEKKLAKSTAPSLLEKLNASVAVEQEETILMGHEYDGIRELDNDLPPWWKYGFYLTIVVAVVYLFHYHVFNTGKLSLGEYEQEMKDGALAVAEYQKTSLDLVDENTVKLLTDEASIKEGKAIYQLNCIACHGQLGEGGMGPNFTDDYWLYGGSVNDIFRSIKYGRPNGMKAWQTDLGPAQIQVVVSFLKSLRGTNPPNAKDKQGELYLEEGQKPASDSAAPAGDSIPKPGIDSIKK
jgi:cytochrome c oxidase cbb3-type subunit 3